MRWLSRDPLGESGGLNLDAYCRNDPLNKIDPLGLAAIWRLVERGDGGLELRVLLTKRYISEKNWRGKEKFSSAELKRTVEDNEALKRAWASKQSVSISHKGKSKKVTLAPMFDNRFGEAPKRFQDRDSLEVLYRPIIITDNENRRPDSGLIANQYSVRSKRRSVRPDDWSAERAYTADLVHEVLLHSMVGPGDEYPGSPIAPQGRRDDYIAARGSPPEEDSIMNFGDVLYPRHVLSLIENRSSITGLENHILPQIMRISISDWARRDEVTTGMSFGIPRVERKRQDLIRVWADKEGTLK